MGRVTLTRQTHLIDETCELLQSALRQDESSIYLTYSHLTF